MSATPDELKEAQDPNTTAARLWELSQRGGQLALLVAQNIKAPSPLLEALASPKKMLAVIYNPPVTEMTAWHRPELFEWSHEKDVRRAVASHPNAPPSALLRLALHFPDEVFNNPALPLILLGTEWVPFASAESAQQLMRHPGLASLMGASLRAAGFLPA